MADFLILVVQGTDDTQDRLLANLIKKFASDWWHELVGTWVFTGGGGFKEWADRINILLDDEGSQYLLMELKRPGSWSARTSKEGSEWLKGVFSGKEIVMPKQREVFPSKATRPARLPRLKKATIEPPTEPPF